MSNYVKATDFAAKDSLVTGDPLKIISGTEINTELNAIQVAVATKADLTSPAFQGNPTATTQPTGNSSTRLATTAFAQAVGSLAIPIGGIILWSGLISNIPANYAFCNGTNGTPDLRDKFIIGASQDDTSAKTNVTGALTQTGGSKDAVTVSHTHTATSTVTDPGHRHGGIPASDGAGDGFDGDGPFNGQTNVATTGITVATSISTAGESGTNKNLPPYYALAYIMRIS